MPARPPRSADLPLLAACLGLLAVPALAAEVLPRPEAPFAGRIDPEGRNSVPAWPQPPKAPAGAPNVLVVLLDDVGFSAPSTFGGVAETPTLQQLADNGLSYNQFHVTSLCAPTRAATLTGRNHHAAGFGQVATYGYPGYNSVWNKDTVSIAEVLRQNGYGTAAFGKWHNTPAWEITPAGPFEHWPTSLGFEHFYGFFGGAENQWQPRIYRNTTAVEPTRTPEQGYHLIADMADEATRWLHNQDAVYPDKPVFLWFAPGGTHWPHHAPADWIARYQGRFDQGWDKLREETFARQKAAGVIPANAVLTPRPPELPAWDSLSADERKLLARQAEVAAAYLAYTDFQVGRVLSALRELGRGDNTLVLYIAGDNGGEIRGNLHGRDLQDAEGKPASITERLQHLKELGGPAFDNLYSGGWGWADNTPFQYGKGSPAYLGGVRNGLVVSWPARIQDKRAVRSQFSHVTDIVPTIVEATGVPWPERYQGIPQLPLEGVSLLPSFSRADAPLAHTRQYFEIGGTRGIYQDGWWAGARYVSAQPGLWNQAPQGLRDWELYKLDEDYAQSRNLAAQQPEKLKELVALFEAEAKRNDVHPLTPPQAPRPTPAAGRTHFSYREGVQRIPSGNGPDVTRRAHRIEAEVLIPAKGGDGVIIADGGRWGGFSLYVKDGRLVYAANAYGQRSGHIVSTQKLGAGRHTVAFEFSPTGPLPAATPAAPGQPSPAVPGRGQLYIDGKPAGEGAIARIVYGPYETLDVGADLGTPVSSDYPVPFRFGGSIAKVQVELR